MKYENRHDPYRFFDELRKTPVVQVADKVYVVTGYRELLRWRTTPRQLRHRRRVPSRPSRRRSCARVGAEHMEAYGRQPSLIVSDPPKHDKQRRQVMRHFGPPHSPDLIPNMEPISSSSATSCWTGQGQGREHVRRRRRLRLSGAGGGDLQDPGRAVEGRTHLSRLDLRLHGGRRTWARRPRPKKGRPAKRRAGRSTAALKQYMADLIQGYIESPARACCPSW